MLITAGSFFLGLISGLGLALLRDQFNARSPARPPVRADLGPGQRHASPARPVAAQIARLSAMMEGTSWRGHQRAAAPAEAEQSRVSFIGFPC